MLGSTSPSDSVLGKPSPNNVVSPVVNSPTQPNQVPASSNPLASPIPTDTSVIQIAADGLTSQSLDSSLPTSPPLPSALPPVRLPSNSSSAHVPGFPMGSPTAVKADINDTTDKDSSFSTALAAKINGQDVPMSSTLPKLDTVPSMASPSPLLATPNGKTSPIKPISKKRSLKKKMAIAASAFAMVLTVGGLGAGYYLSQQQQDTRQKAASEEVTRTEKIVGAAAFKKFNADWKTFMSGKDKTWEEYVAFAQGDGARYKCDAQIMRVGDEVLYGCDLNATFALIDPIYYSKAESIPASDSKLNEVLDNLITGSALLQKGKGLKLVELTPEIYNSPKKDTVKRYAALKLLRQQLEDKYVKKVDFETISIYFRNEVDPLIPMEQAKIVAKSKMDNLYKRLNAKEITMKQAGAEIASDTIIGDTTGVSLSKLDPRELFPYNAYFEGQKYDFNGRYFTDPVYDDELRSLGEGQMSTVRTCRDYVFTEEQYAAANGSVSTFPFEDSCYIIFKVNKISLDDKNAALQGGDMKELESKAKTGLSVEKTLK